jgi:hypothetical protein
MLSGEGNDNERTWSRSTYTDPRQIWSAFEVPGALSEPIGVFANQPNPHAEKSRALWRSFRWLAGLVIVLLAYRMITGARGTVFSEQFTYQPGVPESSFVTKPFQLTGDGTVDVQVTTGRNNAWLGFDVALINLETGEAHNTSTEVSYYAGVEGGESWSEGSTKATMALPRLPAGQYYLRVEPEGAPDGPNVPYRILVRRDVPKASPYLLALALLLVRPIWVWFRKVGFETRRNAESDYGSSSGDDDSSESDDD